jgi:hypothetical protein
MDAAYGLRIRRGSYQSSAEEVAGVEISEQTASRDLRAMVESKLLEPFGERRARYYLSGDEPMKIREAVRAGRREPDEEDPFVLIRDRRQLSLT